MRLPSPRIRLAQSPQLPALDRQMLGIGLALLAYTLLSWQDATVKWLVATVPVWQVLFVRSAILVAGCAVAGGRKLARHAATTPTRPLLLRRGAVTLAAWFCYFTAARFLPLGQLVTLYFTAPVVVTLLAAPLLGEQVGWMRWLAVGIGFLGTVLAANPAGLSLTPATALVLGAAFLWGYGVILTRRIARREPSLVQMAFNNCFFLVITGIGSALTWHVPDLQETGLLLLVALLGGLGQFSLFESAQHAPASLTAPLEYTALTWAFLLGYLVWGDTPRPNVFAGAALILLAGLLILLTERRFRNARRATGIGSAGPPAPAARTARGGIMGRVRRRWTRDRVTDQA